MRPQTKFVTIRGSPQFAVVGLFGVFATITFVGFFLEDKVSCLSLCWFAWSLLRFSMAFKGLWLEHRKGRRLHGFQPRKARQLQAFFLG